jgi:hypothetical protein
MARYDGGWARRYGCDFERGGAWANTAGWGVEWGGPGPRGWPPRPPSGSGPYDQGAYGDGPYDREVYGGGYPAYRRHPEYDRPPRHVAGRWPDGPAGPGRSGFGREIDDGDIRQFVREGLYGDSWLDAERIQVEVQDGVVTLRGEVADYMEARYAWDDAWESPGVRGVMNHLTVRTGSRTEE